MDFCIIALHVSLDGVAGNGVVVGNPQAAVKLVVLNSGEARN